MAVLIKPDLILLDIQLPAMDCYAVARKLRQIQTCRHAHCCRDVLCHARRLGEGNGSQCFKRFSKCGDNIGVQAKQKTFR